MPAVGERVVSLGYVKTQISRSETEERVAYTIQNALHATMGRVTAQHPSGQPESLIKFPAFETDTRMDFGMSGGPVFSQNERGVSGMNSMSRLGDGFGPTHESFVSLAASVLEMPDPRDAPERGQHLFHLAKAGRITVLTGFEFLRFTDRISEGGGTSLSFAVRAPL